MPMSQNMDNILPPSQFIIYSTSPFPFTTPSTCPFLIDTLILIFPCPGLLPYYPRPHSHANLPHSSLTTTIFFHSTLERNDARNFRSPITPSALYHIYRPMRVTCLCAPRMSQSVRQGHHRTFRPIRITLSGRHWCDSSSCYHPHLFHPSPCFGYYYRQSIHFRRCSTCSTEITTLLKMAETHSPPSAPLPSFFKRAFIYTELPATSVAKCLRAFF